MEASYQIASAKVAHQIIDGEVIVIHYDTGFYYSFSGAAADLWQMLAQPQTVATLSARFRGADDEVQQTVKKFIGHLLSEKLVQSCAGAAVIPAVDGASTPIGDLDFQKYDDMRAIFFADPIHEVEDEGWPVLKAQD